MKTEEELEARLKHLTGEMLKLAYMKRKYPIRSKRLKTNIKIRERNAEYQGKVIILKWILKTYDKEKRET